MTLNPAAEWDFYESYYTLRLMPKLGLEMAGCEGLFPWLAENDPELYARIGAGEKEIDSLWLSRGDKEAFKAACRSWYELLLEAKKALEAGRAREREKVLSAGRQEKMVMR